MPRASRYMCEGFTYHLTHRCHDGRFLLKFRQERDAYREWLRIGVRRYGVSVYGYCITSNHVHVVAAVENRERVASLMQLPSGVVAKSLNLRKDHEDSVWEHPYQCTLIENGTHLLRCLRYVDLNMVRAGRVAHPKEWRWCGYDELTGRRDRYRILDLERLAECLELPDTAALFELHGRGIEEQIARRELAREAHWTESLAVGGLGFVTSAEALYAKRRHFVCCQLGAEFGSDAWAVRESSSSYTTDSEPKPTV